MCKNTFVTINVDLYYERIMITYIYLFSSVLVLLSNQDMFKCTPI